MSTNSSFWIDRQRLLSYGHLCHQGQRWEWVRMGIGSSLRGFLSSAATRRSRVSVSSPPTQGRLGRWSTSFDECAAKLQTDAPNDGYPERRHPSSSFEDLDVISFQENVANSVSRIARGVLDLVVGASKQGLIPKLAHRGKQMTEEFPFREELLPNWRSKNRCQCRPSLFVIPTKYAVIQPRPLSCVVLCLRVRAAKNNSSPKSQTGCSKGCLGQKKNWRESLTGVLPDGGLCFLFALFPAVISLIGHCNNVFVVGEPQSQSRRS
jgi:hypothetical protein